MAGFGAWGPVARGGRGRHWPRLLLAALLSAGIAATAATASVVRLTFDAVTQNLERAAVEGLDTPEEPDEPLYVLVVGSDAREDLTDAERQALSLGTFEGERSDTVLLVAISADRQDVSIVSFPRDLLVTDVDGGAAKLTETYGDGREELVRAVTEDLGFPVNHYVEVSITGFIETVAVVGSVEICLEEPLVDRKSGADLPAGCQDLEPAEALAFVRSRQGAFGDFERIERQQQFLRALVREILDTRLLLDPGRFVAVAREVAGNLTVDEGLTVPLMVDLSQDLQGALLGGVEMVTVPAFPRQLEDDGLTKDFVIAYQPGLEALVAEVEQGQSLASRGTRAERAAVEVQLYVADRPFPASLVESTLAAAGFGIAGIRQGPDGVVGDTVVHPVPGFEEHAAWVAAHIGAEVVPLPADLDAPEDSTVVVVVGEDAEEAAGTADTITSATAAGTG
jgi:LCP family protein required for cell wall assembly